MMATVRRGTADVGMIIRSDGEPLDSLGGFGPAPIIIVSDPVRGVAVPMLKGQVQKAYFAALPDELIRDGYDQTPTVDPDNVRFVFQGMWDKDKSGRNYGQFQWRIGMLTPAADR